jgi:hypothetical protein
MAVRGRIGRQEKNDETRTGGGVEVEEKEEKKGRETKAIAGNTACCWPAGAK